MQVIVRSIDNAVITASLYVQLVSCRVKQLDHTPGADPQTDR